MTLVTGSHRVFAIPGCDAAAGRVKWSPAKSLWIGGMTSGAVIFAPLYFSWSAVALFFATSAMTLCLGHSIGMHRRLIHESFQCPRWLEYFCVYLGVLVGMAGPIGMIRIHDMRDWAQRQEYCHDFFAHRAPFFVDGWRQLHCVLDLNTSPRFQLEPRLANDRIYALLERTWMLQQIPWAIIFFMIGGVPWVVWGIFVRVTVSVTGHWLVGHFAHRQGHQSFVVDGAAVQGYNVRIAGLISMGESWHNNHHAFPGSARLGLHDDEIDIGYWVIEVFERFGLVWDIVTPDRLPHRAALRRSSDTKPPGCPINRRLRLTLLGLTSVHRRSGRTMLT
jgi:fatty-acid desaturase